MTRVALITLTETIITWIYHLSLSSITIAPPPSQLYTLHCTTTLCMSHTNSFFPNRLPCSGSKSSSSSSSTSKQRCLSVSHTALYCSTVCTSVFHSSRQPTSSHPPHQQLPTIGPSITTTTPPLLPSRTAAPSSTSSHTNTYAIHERDTHIYMVVIEQPASTPLLLLLHPYLDQLQPRLITILPPHHSCTASRVTSSRSSSSQQ